MGESGPAFYVTGGSLRSDTPSYIERQADSELYEALCRGEFCYILTARQIGKSSLKVRTATRLRQEDVHVAVLDFTAVGQNLTAEQWYYGLLDRLGEQLGLDVELDAFWLDHERLGPLRRFMAALRQTVLPCLSGRIVVFIDEIDVVRGLPFSTDEFFAAIRECYNLRTEDTQFDRLTFCLLGVAAPSDLIRDTRMTPFNIGRRIELNDFTATEAAPLERGLEGVAGRSQQRRRSLLERILYWTGGHPYLTQRLCLAVAEAPCSATAATVDELAVRLFLSHQAQERDDNLIFVRERMLRSEADLAALLELYRKVWSGKRVLDDDTDPLGELMRLSGIARAQAGCLRVRNRIYARVFDGNWVRMHMPNAELRRQRAAFRRGVLRTYVVSSTIVAAMGLLVWRAVRSENHTQQALARVTSAERGTDRQLYAARMNLALQAADEGETGRAQQLLDRMRPRSDQEDLRGFEWRYLWRLLQTNQRFIVRGNTAVAASPDGKTLAAGGEDNTIKVWDFDTGREVVTLKGHEAFVSCIAFSPNGKTLASGSEDHTVRLWDVASWRAVAVLRGPTAAVRTVAFSPDGRTLASGGDDDAARLWNVVLRREVARLPENSSVFCVAFSPNGKTIALGCGHPFELWDVASRQRLATLTNTESDALAFSPDGKMLALGNYDGTVGLWDVATRRMVSTLKGHHSGVSSVAFSRDGKRLASGSGDGTVRLWNVATRKAAGVLVGHAGSIQSVTFASDDMTLATVGEDQTVRVWDVGRKRDTTVLQAGGWMESVAFASDGKMLASAGGAAGVILWDPADGHKLAALNCPSFNVAFSPDSRTLAIAGCDGTVRLWDIPSRVVHVLRGHNRLIHSVAFSPDGRTLASASEDTTVRLWDTASRQQIAVLTGHTESVRGAVFSPDSKILASASEDATVRLWDVATRKALRTLPCDSGLSSVTFSRDGRTLAASQWDGLIRLWDTRTRREITRLQGAAGTPTIAFSPDGKRIATADGDFNVRLWNPAIQDEDAILRGHTGPARSVAFSPDGATLASSSSDGTVRLWHTASFAEADARR